MRTFKQLDKRTIIMVIKMYYPFSSIYIRIPHVGSIWVVRASDTYPRTMGISSIDKGFWEINTKRFYINIINLWGRDTGFDDDVFVLE